MGSVVQEQRNENNNSNNNNVVASSDAKHDEDKFRRETGGDEDCVTIDGFVPGVRKMQIAARKPQLISSAASSRRPDAAVKNSKEDDCVQQQQRGGSSYVANRPVPAASDEPFSGPQQIIVKPPPVRREITESLLDAVPPPMTFIAGGSPPVIVPEAVPPPVMFVTGGLSSLQILPLEDDDVQAGRRCGETRRCPRASSCNEWGIDWLLRRLTKNAMGWRVARQQRGACACCCATLVRMCDASGMRRWDRMKLVVFVGESCSSRDKSWPCLQPISSPTSAAPSWFPEPHAALAG